MKIIEKWRWWCFRIHSFIMILLWNGKYYFMPCAKTEALRVIWCRNSLSFHFIKFSMIFFLLSFSFLSGCWNSEVWICTYLNFLERQICFYSICLFGLNYLSLSSEKYLREVLEIVAYEMSISCFQLISLSSLR